MALAESSQKKIFDDRFEILDIVGRGARSVVYHARHLDGDQEDVALKVLLTRKSNDKTLSDLLRKEALALVSCRHPYVIRLDDFHALEDVCYLAMEYAPEFDLRKYLAKMGGVLPVDQAALYLRQCLEGLAFIHLSGIIHRDLKPDNLLVVDETNIRIGDFGVALLPGEPSSLSDLQRGIGTLDYMPPEVLSGESCDERSDIYGIALSLFECLTGKHPFQGLPLIHQLEVRKDGNFADIKTLRPETPQGLSDAIMKALRFQPQDRFASAQEFLDAIASFVPASEHGAHDNLDDWLLDDSLFDDDLLDEASHVESGDASQGSPKRDIFDLYDEDEESQPVFEADRSDSLSVNSKKTPPQQAPSPWEAAADKRSPETQIPESSPFVRGQSEDPSFDVDAYLQSELGDDFFDLPESHYDKKVTEAAPRTKVSRGQVHPDSQQDSHSLHVELETHEKKLERAEEQENISREEKKKPFAASDTYENPFVRSSSSPSSTQLSALLRGALVGLAILGFVLFVAKFLGIMGSTSQPEDSRTAIALSMKENSLLVHQGSLQQNPQQSTSFPFLPEGMYRGALEGLLPGVRALPLHVVSLPQRELLVVSIGIPGWKPSIIHLEDVRALHAKRGENYGIEIAQDGFLLHLQASEHSPFEGVLENRMTGFRGRWVLMPQAQGAK